MVKCSSTKTACQTQTSLKLMSGVISIWFIFANTFLFCTLPSPEPNSAEHRSHAAVLFLNTVFSSLFTDTMFRTKNVQFTLYSDSGSPKTSEGCLVLNLQTIKTGENSRDPPDVQRLKAFLGADGEAQSKTNTYSTLLQTQASYCGELSAPSLYLLLHMSNLHLPFFKALDVITLTSPSASRPTATAALCMYPHQCVQ